jgi:hypothetical protein
MEGAMNIRTLAAMLSLSALTVCGAARAQAEDVVLDEEAEPAEEEAAGGEEADEEAGTDEAVEAGDGADEGSASVAEKPGETYRFIGARYRGIIIPTFMLNLFADGGQSVYVHAFGPEFAIRKDGFEYNLSAWLGFYGMDPTAFKGKDDDDFSWETVESNLKILYLTSDFLWSHSFNPQFAVNYGVGAGFGIVFGDLRRNQTTPADPASPGDPNDWVFCTEAERGTTPYCDDENDHYGNYTEPSWANGGSKPLIFPWLALQTGLRYKPSPKFVGRLDVGFGTSGFFFGLGADYGL